MSEGWRIFLLLMYKNAISYKRHWGRTASEIITPVLYFSLNLYVTALLLESFVSDDATETGTTTNLVRTVNEQTTLYYVPQNNFTDGIMQLVQNCLHLPEERIKAFKSESQMLMNHTQSNLDYSLTEVLAIVFDGNGGNSISNMLGYMIKTPSQLLNESYYNYETTNGTDQFATHISLQPVQECMNNSFMRVASADNEDLTNATTETNSTQSDIAIIEGLVKQSISMGAAYGLIAITFVLPAYFTSEKQIGINALMAMNGVRSYLNLLSWQIMGMAVSLTYVSALTLVFKISFVSGINPWLNYGNGFLFWLYLLVNVAHVIAYSLHIAAYFSRPFLAQAVSVVLYYAVIIIGELLIQSKVYALVPIVGILVPSLATRRIFEEFAAFEITTIGTQWSNLFEAGDSSYNSYGSLGCCMIYAILGIVLNFTLAVYVDAVVPNKYGVHKHPLFFLEFFKRAESRSNDGDDALGDAEIDTKKIEAVADGTLTPGIQIRNLRKNFLTSWFPKREVEAIRGITLDFYKGQITALLGHNGAGKTTTMSILTGLTGPSVGTVYINGKNIREDLNEVRSDIGLCPQENMLFPNFTVFEQIQFFGMLKRRNETKDKIKDEVNSLLQKLGITHKKNAMPANLSGGQKRRVCLGMAVIGNASVLILDEPTSGMDPETRRETWDIILRMRGQKTIIISSHSMEEADILGDRVAIMHQGRVKCYGTSMFLKKLYGNGSQEVTLSIEPWCDMQKILSLMDPRTLLENNSHGSMRLSIPYTNSLPETLDKMENQKKELGITGISLSIITLEQVFLKVTKEEDGDSDSREKPLIVVTNKLTGWQLSVQVFNALIAKKMVYARKNLVLYLIIIIGPLFAVLLMVFLDHVVANTSVDFSTNSSISNYSRTFFSSESNELKPEYKGLYESFRSTLHLSDPGDNLTEGTSPATPSEPITTKFLSNKLLTAFAGRNYKLRTLAISQMSRNSSASEIASTTAASTISLMKSLMFIMSFCICTGFYVINPLLETSTVVKQLQRMTGVRFSSYWGTMFLFDCIVFVIGTLFILLFFYLMDLAFGVQIYRGKEIGVIALLLMLFAMNILPLLYIHSFLKKSAVTVLLIVCLIPMVFAMVEGLLFVSLKEIADYAEASLIQQRVFSLVPQVSLALALIKLFNVASSNGRCRRLTNEQILISCMVQDTCCALDCYDGVCNAELPYFTDFEEDSGLEEFMLYLVGTSFILFILLWILDSRVIMQWVMKMQGAKLRNKSDNMDDDVGKEKVTVAHGINEPMLNASFLEVCLLTMVQPSSPSNKDPTYKDENIFLVYELSKYYGKLGAVREVNFRVKKHECFGLLGVNGAGKSTTFRLLTGEEIPSSGILHLGHSNIESDRRKYLSQMGYCPQTDAIIPSLNAWDHLRLFALLRGIPKSEVDNEVIKWIDMLNLNAYAEHPSGTYSGGNKRRLNIAMALIANPELVLLDEPTTGVDPAARRSLWGVLQACQAAGQAIILTSHSMEECEALCSRLVIMAKGELVCIGASQQLKQRFGAGYDIEMKLNPGRSDAEVEAIKKDIHAALTCELRDEHTGLLSYHVIDAATTWQKMFGTMSDMKQKYSCIEDSSVSSATLEQLFIQFAKSAKNFEPKVNLRNGSRIVPV